MPLTFIARSVPIKSAEYYLLQAEDQNGVAVAVKVSDEVLLSQNRFLIEAVASAKFDGGDTEQDGSVLVHITDCR